MSCLNIPDHPRGGFLATLGSPCKHSSYSSSYFFFPFQLYMDVDTPVRRATSSQMP